MKKLVCFLLGHDWRCEIVEKSPNGYRALKYGCKRCGKSDFVYP